MKFGVADYGMNVWYGGLYDIEERLIALKSLGFNGTERLEAATEADAIHKAALYHKLGMDFSTCRGPNVQTNIQWSAALGKQYTWLPYSEPGLDEIITRKLLSWYTLDVGYHGVALNGAGYFRDLDDLLGTGVPMVGNVNGTYVGDEFYMDMNGPKTDPRLKK